MTSPGQFAVNASPYQTVDSENQRANAVAAALELIASKLSSGASTNLEGEIANLSKYADQIQAALKVK